MGARKTGGGASNRRMRDANNAARMKRDGTTRKKMKCPLCHNTIDIGTLNSHFVAACKGGNR